MFGLCVIIIVSVPAFGATPSILRYASARRLFSFGDTTRPPSVRSAVFSISVNSASTTVSYVLGSTAVVRDRRIVEGVDG